MTELCAVRSTAPLTAAGAIAWFTSRQGARGMAVGYTLATDTAGWLRLHPDGTLEPAPGGRVSGGASGPSTPSSATGAADPLAAVYELVLFDGERELRWLREHGRTGPAVVLGESPAGLPDGADASIPGVRRGRVQQRMLAGTVVEHPAPGWVLLRSERYASAVLPEPSKGAAAGSTPSTGALVIEHQEYLGEDGHGNVDVVATRYLRLSLRPARERGGH